VSTTNGSPTPTSGSPKPHLNNSADILQASTTVTSLTVALIALFPSTSLAKIELVKIGGQWSLTLGPVLLLCGVSALISSLWSVDHLRREASMTVRALMQSNLGLLLIALILFLVIYVGIAASY